MASQDDGGLQPEGEGGPTRRETAEMVSAAPAPGASSGRADGGAPQDPTPDEVAAVFAPKPPLWRRGLWALFLLLIGTLGVATGAVTFLFSDAGREAVRDRVVATLAERSAGDVKLEGLDYALFGPVGLRGLVLEDASGREAVALDRAEVVLDWDALLDGDGERVVIEAVRLEGLRLHVVEGADGRVSVDGLVETDPEALERLRAEPPPEALQVLVGELEVVGTQLKVERADGGVVTLEGGTVKGTAELWPGQERGTIELARVGGSLQVQQPPALGGGELRVRDLATAVTLGIEAGAVTAKVAPVTGELAFDTPNGTKRTLPLRFEGLEATRTADGRLDVDAADFVLPHEAIDALTGRAMLKDDVTVRFGAEGPPEAVVVRGEVQTSGGRLGLEGTFDLSDPTEPRYTMALTGEDIDTTALLVEPPVAVTTGVTATLKGVGLTPGSMQANVNVDVGATVIDGRPVDGLGFEGRLEGGELTISDLHVDVLGQRVTLVGGLNRGSGEVKAALTTKADLGDLLRELEASKILPAPLPPLDGEDVSVDLKVTGVLAEAALEGTLEPGAPASAALERAHVTGTVTAGPLVAREGEPQAFRLGGATMEVDLKVQGGKPKGTIALRLTDVQTAGVALPSVVADVVVDGESWTITSSGRDPALDIGYEARLSAVVDLVARSVGLTFEQLDVSVAGRTAGLAEPVALELPEGFDLRGHTLALPDLALRFGDGAGQLALGGRVSFDEGDPPAPTDVDLRVDLDGVRLGGLPVPKAQRWQLGRLGGTVDGGLTVRGRLPAPAVTVGTRWRKGPIAAAVDGAIGTDRRAQFDVAVTARGRKLATIALDAGLADPAAGKPGLDANAPLTVDVDSRGLGRRTLRDLATLLPSKARRDLLAQLEGLPSDLRVDSEVAIRGTAGKPKGTIGFSARGEGLPQAEGEFTLRTRGAGLRVAGDLALTPPDGSAPAPVAVQLDLARSPLTPAGARSRFTLTADVGPMAVGPWIPAPPDGGAPPAITGTLSAQVEATGRLGSRTPPSATARFTLADLSAPAPPGWPGPPLPATTLAGTAELGRDAIRFDSTAQVAGLEGPAVAVSGELGASVATLPKALAAMTLPVQLKVDVPERPLTAWGALAGDAVRGLADVVGGTLAVGVDVAGTAALPTADVTLMHRGWAPLEGEGAGATAARVVVGAEQLNATVVAGAGAVLPESAEAVGVAASLEGQAIPPLRVDVSAPRDMAIARAVAGVGPLDVQARVRGSGAQIATLLPALEGLERVDFEGLAELAAAARAARAEPGSEAPAPMPPQDPEAIRQGLEALRAAGARLDGDLTATVRLDDWQGRPPLELAGELTVRDGAFPLPGTGRAFHGVGLTLTGAEGGGLRIANLQVLEKDVEKDARALRVNGDVQLTPGGGLTAALDIVTDDWLVVGAPDAPEGEIDSHMVITADLTKPVATVDVLVDAVDLDKPIRYIRDHWQQMMHLGDVQFIEDDAAIGVLPPMPPNPLAALPSELPPDSAAPTEASMPPRWIDVAIRIPEPIHLVHDPLVLDATGAINLQVRDGAVQAKGGLTFHSGEMEFLGDRLKLVEGGVDFPGPLAELRARMQFAKAAPLDSLRGQVTALPGGEDSGTTETTVTLVIEPGVSPDPQVLLSGSAGPYLVDAMAVHLQQRGQWWNAPGLRASSVAQVPFYEAPMVLAFVNTNLPHLVFMDRVNAFARPGTLMPEWYGRVQRMTAENTVGDGPLRVRVEHRPQTVARSELELGLDYLFVRDRRWSLGLGAFGGTSPRAGLELFLEFATPD